MTTLDIHKDAAEDLRLLKLKDLYAAAEIVAFLREAKSSPKLLETFNSHGYGKDRTDRHDVSRWETQYRKHGRNLYRLKLRHLEDAKAFYRVIYAYRPPGSFYVLGVVRHDLRQDDFDYNDEDAFTKRIVAVYDRLGLPRY